ncbi:MAG: ATP-binding protein [Acidobacteriota bacterium]|nr:ATP-binding protein [Acidobacteriota bacterium]
MRERSLKRKLIIRNTTTLSVVFATFVVFLVLLNYYHYRDQIKRYRQRAQAVLVTQGEVLVRDKGLMFPDDIEYNRFGKIGDILLNNAQTVEEIVYGGFFEADFSLWAWVEAETGPDRTPVKRDIDRRSLEQVKTSTSEWALSLTDYSMRRHPDRPDVYEFATPVYSRPEVYEDDIDDRSGAFAGDRADSEKILLGAVVYGLSTAAMEPFIAEQNNIFRANLARTLGIMTLLCLIGLIFGIVVTLRQAANITHPLETLTSAADTIAGGNYDIAGSVNRIQSGDELQTLASSFAQMADDVKTSDEKLRAKNRELSMAYEKLEDLNRHLEDKVEERTKQLRESEQKFRTLFDQSADAILVSTEERFLDCNKAMLDMLGLESKEVFLAMLPGDIVPEELPEEIETYHGLEHYFDLARSEGSQYFEWANKRIDGEVFPTEIVITSFTLNGENVMHMVLRDITERKKTESILKVTQQQLVETAHSAGMAEIATGVLHNIGNILNSVNISTEEIAGTLKSSKLKGFIKANEIVAQNVDNLGDFFTVHPKGRLIPGYYLSLGEAMHEEHHILTEEITDLVEKVSMMRDVISTQQNYAKATLYTDDILIQNIIEDSLKLQLASLQKQGVKVIKDYRINPRGSVPKVKLIHVLTNLIKNGKEAMYDNDRHNKDQRLEITLRELPNQQVEIQIVDNGCGIHRDHLEKIFNHGFTTKEQGHGFGLHTCANFMAEMGGNLSVESDGVDLGSRFTVRFPLVVRIKPETEETPDEPVKSVN